MEQTQPSNLDLIISESLCFDTVGKDAVFFLIDTMPADLNCTTLSILGVRRLKRVGVCYLSYTT